MMKMSSKWLVSTSENNIKHNLNRCVLLDTQYSGKQKQEYIYMLEC